MITFLHPCPCNWPLPVSLPTSPNLNIASLAVVDSAHFAHKGAESCPYIIFCISGTDKSGRPPLCRGSYST